VRIRTSRYAGLLLVASSLSALAPLSFGGVELAAQALVCDPSLAQRSADPQGYRLRGDRCEGVYAQPVAGTNLLVASFSGSFSEYDRLTRDLGIRWPASEGGAVHLRALSLRRKLYYRMDTAQPASAGAWTWPLDLLTSLGIKRPELGIVGWTRRRVGDVERDVYLPLRVGGDAARDTRGYTLVLLPQVQLTEVYVTVAAVDADGRPATWLRDDAALGYRYYPADRPIEIQIERPTRPGIYYVLIGAAMSSGASLTTELWFDAPYD
jgi:hypothetical protein